MAIQPFLPFDVEEETLPRLLTQVGEVCRELPLEEKILVSPSLSIGHQVVERLALSGRPWMNLRVETVRNLAHATIGPALAREGLKLLSRAQALALIEQACAETLSQDSHFGRLRGRPGLHRALQRTFDELRAAGISGASLPERAFPDKRKAGELKMILHEYEDSLAKGKFADRAEVLARAARAIRQKKFETGAALYFVPENLEFSPGEREFFEPLAAGRLRILSAEAPTAWRSTARSAQLFHALGEENEVREVFRRLLAGVPFDQAEILHTDPGTYPALIYELSEQYGIGCTFAEGVAVTFTRPGQAALGFLRWIARGYEAETLIQTLVAGRIDLKTLSAEVAPLSAARVLRAAEIGWGRQRHLSRLDRRIQELEAPKDPSREGSLEEPDPVARAASRSKQLAAARIARALVARLLALAPEPAEGTVDLRVVARGAKTFVAELARVSSELDGMAASALEKLFAEFEALPAARLPLAEAVERLANAVLSLHVAADRPRPGRLHVAEYRSGGHSGRPHTYLVGLDATRHPGMGIQDPVLVDEERRNINASLAVDALPIWSDRPKQNTLALQSCLARLSGRLTASFSSRRLLPEAGEQFPAPFFLELYREKTGDSAADYSQLKKSLPAGCGFLPGARVGAASEALDEVEWWLARLTESGAGGEGARIVRAAYPWLADGSKAQDERASSRFTLYDGWVQADADELDPRATQEPVSPSKIETLARCPYAYFLRHVLRIEPPEEPERGILEWLDARRNGSLLHEVFRRFFEEISSRGEKPSVARHAGRLEEIAAEAIALWRERVPPRSDVAFNARCEEILFACRTLLRLEEKHCGDVTPRFFEVPFGLLAAPLQSPLASAEPVSIALSTGRQFQARGRIDRIDQASDGTYDVWDYKTGGYQSIRPEKGMRGGRQIQYALYAMAARELLARAGEKGEVARSGYFFPGRKGEGQRFTMPLDESKARETLDRLFDLLRDGAFPHAVHEEACKWCDFQIVCGGRETAALASRVKLANEADNPVLDAYRKLDVE